MKNLIHTVLFFVICETAIAQTSTNLPDTTIYLIQTKDGNEYSGTISSQTDDEVVLSTKTLGNITIEKSNIKQMRAVQQAEIKGDQVWMHSAQDARYFWSPNGYGLRKGEGYYQNTWVFFNQASYGITDNITIGVGTIPLFLFGGTPTPVWITPKIQFPVVKDKINIGAGALVGTVAGSEMEGDGSNSFGVAYGLTTFGSRNSNVSVGIGYGFAGGEWADYPTLTFSGMNRVGKNWYLITENYLIDGGDYSVGIISAGARWKTNKSSIDFALMAPVTGELDTFLPLPWLSFAVPFGK